MLAVVVFLYHRCIGRGNCYRKVERCSSKSKSHKKHCNINNKGHFLPTVGWISASVFPAHFHYDLSSINCKSVRQSRKTLKTYFQIKSPVRKFSFSDDNNFLLVCPPTLPIFDKLYFSETRGVVPTCTAPKDRLFNIWDSL